MAVGTHIIVMCAVRHSFKRVILYHTNRYIVVSSHIAVMCTVRHSLERIAL
jgi:hypothetical protein